MGLDKEVVVRRAVSINIICLLLLSTCVSGCVPLLIGSAGVVAGYLITKDAVSGNIDTTYTELWDTSMSVLRERGEIIDYKRDLGWIKSLYMENSVIVEIKELTDNSFKLTVKARKAIALANTKLAQEIFTKIIRNLDSGQETIK